METIVTQIIENWKTMSKEDFDEFMLNQEKILLREEMEQIIDAWDNGRYGSSNFFEDYNNAKQYFLETYKTD